MLEEKEKKAWKNLLKVGWEARREGGYLTPNINGQRKKVNRVRDLNEIGCDKDVKFLLFPGKQGRNRHQTLLSIQEEEPEEVLQEEMSEDEEKSEDEVIDNQEEGSKDEKQDQACILTSTY